MSMPSRVHKCGLSPAPAPPTSSPGWSAPALAHAYLPDHVVLKKTDISMADSSDDWTTFDLEDAIVLDAHGNNMENGLLVETRGPFVIRGCLRIDRSVDEQVERRKSAWRTLGRAPRWHGG